jgi:spermidine dehydrogenase
MFHDTVALTEAARLGGVVHAQSPDEPIALHLTQFPAEPGLPRREQHKIGRARLLATSFEDFERETRSQLARLLGPGGFDPARDIAAITVNRWPHGYSYTYDTLDDQDVPDEQRPHILGRQSFGRMAIANADASASAFTNTAIDMGERAVQECLISRGLI